VFRSIDRSGHCRVVAEVLQFAVRAWVDDVDDLVPVRAPGRHRRIPLVA